MNKRIGIKLINRTNKEIEISEATSIPDDMLSGRNDILVVTIPEGIETISRNAFEGCRALTEVKLPKSIKEIGEEAFANCTSLKKINIPEGAVVDKTAFMGCLLL